MLNTNLLFQNVPSEKFIPCLLRLCKLFWCILVCYYQVALWHHNTKSVKPGDSATIDTCGNDGEQNFYIQQKFKSGYSRIWNDIQSKISVFLCNSSKLHTLKYEQFIQVLSIVQRLRKVGFEFCNEPSNTLMDAMRKQSTQFFQRYHVSCLEEICLFLDNEAWMPVNDFSSLIQLQEFNSVKSSLQRFLRKDKMKLTKTSDEDASAESKDLSIDSLGATVMTNNRLSPSKRLPERKKSIENQLNNNFDETLSIHSQEDCSSSVYGSCGYFLRFSEKSSPFDGGFDEAMLEEDILAGIADESSCYFSEESEEEQVQDNSVIATNDSTPTNSILSKATVTVNNSSLNVLRCIGRYLQMCKLLHSISPVIVKSMTELVEFYIYVVYEFFAKDMVSYDCQACICLLLHLMEIFSSQFQPLSGDSLFTNNLMNNINRISAEIVPKVRNGPLSTPIVSVLVCSEQ